MAAWSRRLRQIAASTTRKPDQNLRKINGTLTAVAAGAATDGSAQATVTVGADAFPAPYLASYTPHVSDMVAVLFVDGSPLILGRVSGPPSF